MSLKPTLSRLELEKREILISDTVGQIAHEVGIIESLAVAAATIGGNTGDDRTCRRRLVDLAVQIEGAARQAFETARSLDEKINLGAES